MQLGNRDKLFTQIRDYDTCFEEFLKPSGNGQKLLQAILLREAFSLFALRGVAIKQNTPTVILDVGCGPGDYSVAWTSQIARLLPKGITFYCTDYRDGISSETGETYAMTTAKKMEAAAKNGKLRLAQAPVATDADLFFGRDALMPAGKTADIVHWSHSGYHVRDALGAARNDPRAIEAGVHAAVDKMWAAIDKMGLMVSIHETRDNSDGIQSQIGPVSRKYCGRLDDVPERTAAHIEQLGGYVAAVNFASPLKFLGLDDAGWERLKQRAQWDRLSVFEARALRLLNFIAFDFSDPAKAALETLAENGRLAAYVDEYKSIVATNGGHIVVKCAFQMISKSQPVARKLDDIVFQLTEKMHDFSVEMAAEMRRS
jgi:SAM-dependent methyltransferase